MIIIGISGKSEVGKDYLGYHIADYLRKVYNYKVKIYSFSNPLKKIVKELYNLEDYHVNTATGKSEYLHDWKVTPRYLLQTIGTDVLRNYDSDIFVKSFDDKIEKGYFKNVNIIIITDIRFANEANYVLNTGGLLFNVISESIDINNRKYSHSSENQKIENSIILYNNKIDNSYIETALKHIILYLDDINDMIITDSSDSDSDFDSDDITSSNDVIMKDFNY